MKWRRETDLFILVREKRLEHFTVGNDWMPAHPGHPGLQALHTHLYELFLKSSWNRRQKTDDLKLLLFLFF